MRMLSLAPDMLIPDHHWEAKAQTCATGTDPSHGEQGHGEE